MLIQGKLLSYGSDLSDVYMIRRKVFLDEMNLPEGVEFDSLDDMAMHVIVHEEAGSTKAVATGRITYDGGDCEIGHIAVLKEYRNKKYGDFTVRMLLNKAFTAGVNDVSCIVFANTIAFFEKIGFHKVDETPMYQNNHEYFRMVINSKEVRTECHKVT
jgi:ribosomal protein S18 acetylase RimI-like enzyme